jgi:phage RecT family recombinase
MFASLKTQLISNRESELEAISRATGVSAKKIALAAITLLQGKPELWPFVAANPGAFITCVLTAAEQGLDFGKPNEVHLVGYKKNERPNKITLQRGYKGWLKLARRAPDIADVEAYPIYANDIYSRTIGASGTVILEKVRFGAEKGELIGFVALAYMCNGRVKFEEMTVAEIIQHSARFTKASSYGPFADLTKKGVAHENFIPYGLKTVLIRLCGRQLDLSSEVSSAMEEFQDETPLAAIVAKELEPVAPSPVILSLGNLAGVDLATVGADDLGDYLADYAESIPEEEAKAIISTIGASQ